MDKKRKRRKNNEKNSSLCLKRGVLTTNENVSFACIYGNFRYGLKMINKKKEGCVYLYKKKDIERKNKVVRLHIYI